MPRGRKPIPTAIRELNGYFKQNPQRKNYLEPDAPQDPPVAPEGLDEIAKAEWDSMVETLHELNILSSCDRAMLELYCRTYSRWREAEEMVIQQGAVYEGKRNPWDIIRRDNLASCHKLLSEFGLSPSSRSRVSANKTMNQITKIKPRDRKPSEN